MSEVWSDKVTWQRVHSSNTQHFCDAEQESQITASPHCLAGDLFVESHSPSFPAIFETVWTRAVPSGYARHTFKRFFTKGAAKKQMETTSLVHSWKHHCILLEMEWRTRGQYLRRFQKCKDTRHMYADMSSPFFSWFSNAQWPTDADPHISNLTPHPCEYKT